MLTIKKRERRALAIVAAAGVFVTACGPPGPRALHRGDSLVQSGNYDEAVTQLKAAVNLLSGDTNTVLQAKAANLLGLAYHGAGKPAEARQCYFDALKLDRNLAAADYNLGWLELQQTNLLQARDAFTTYVTLCPTNLDGYLQLGLTYYRMAMQSPLASDKPHLFDNARQVFVRAQLIKETVEAGNYIGIIDIQRRAQPTPDSVSDAIYQFKKVLSYDSHYPPALLNMAIVYDKYVTDGKKDAKFAYGEYIQLQPSPPLFKEVSFLYTNLDREMRFQINMKPASPSGTAAPTGATAIPSNVARPPAIAAPPPHPAQSQPQPVPAVATSAYHSPSQTGASAQPQEPVTSPATAASDPAASAQPANNDNGTAETTTPEKVSSTGTAPAHKPSILNPLNWFGGRAKADSSDSSANGSDASLMVTPLPSPQSVPHYAPPPVATNPGNRAEAEHALNVGTEAEKEARVEDAMASYGEAVKADPAYFEPCQALGMAAIKEQKYDIALEALNHALALKPDSAESQYGYAWALEKKHFYQDAANELEKMLTQHPAEVRAHLLLAEIYAQHLGQLDLARAHYQKVLDADPQNSQATSIRFWLQANSDH